MYKNNNVDLHFYRHRRNTMRKKIKYLFYIPTTNRCNFQLSFGCTHLRVRWGHARRHGKRSLGMLTVERADYTQEMDCHYFNSWSVHRWGVCKSLLVLMGQLNIVVFGTFATFAVSSRLVLSVEHELEIAGPTAPTTASTRHWQPECPSSVNMVNKNCVFSAFWQSHHCW